MLENKQQAQWNKPIYSGIRNFIGFKDLVISFYAQKCQFECSFCNLPSKSHPEPLSTSQIKAQIDWVFEHYADKLQKFEQFSTGNEGSIIDWSRFPQEAMLYLLERVNKEMTNLKVMSLETRPEFITAESIKKIRKALPQQKLDMTVGFETQDEHLRQVVLKKTIRRKNFEQKIQLLGEFGVRMTSYVLLKPSPVMTERAGIEEAILTIEYLADICNKFSTELVIYLNPVYAAKGSPLAEEFALQQYKPVRIQSVVEVIGSTRHLNIPIYTGLWTEDNGEANGDYTSHDDYQPQIRDALAKFNKSQDIALIQSFFPENVLQAEVVIC